MAPPVTAENTTTNNNNEASSSAPAVSPSTLSYIMAAVILGSSAGMTLYSRRSGAMLSRIQEINKNHALRHPPKIGPVTKSEYDKLRPRLNDPLDDEDDDVDRIIKNK